MRQRTQEIQGQAAASTEELRTAAQSTTRQSDSELRTASRPLEDRAFATPTIPTPPRGAVDVASLVEDELAPRFISIARIAQEFMQEFSAA